MFFQVAWPLIANYSCPTTVNPSPCLRDSNQGWRYFLFTMGGLMLVLFALRFFVFHLYESPKYLMGRGCDAEAVEIIHRVAEYNWRSSSLTLEMLRRAEEQGTNDEKTIEKVDEEGRERGTDMDTSRVAAVKRKLSGFGRSHVSALFRTRKLARSTSLLIVLWGALPPSIYFPLPSRSTPILALIGLAFPL